MPTTANPERLHAATAEAARFTRGYDARLLLATAPDHALRGRRRALRKEEVRSRRGAERVIAGAPSVESVARWTDVATHLLAHRRAAHLSVVKSMVALSERRAVLHRPLVAGGGGRR